MATIHYRNAVILIDGAVLSPSFAELSITYNAETLDQTAFGDTARVNKGGLFNWQVDGRAHQDFGAGAVDATIWPLVGSTTCFEIRPHNSCSTAINPRYFGVGIISTYTPMGGAVGTLLDTPFTLVAAGDLSRSTTAT